jgi:hypothetical protein
MSLTLPAVVSTGDDGSISLRQDETTVSVASNTALEFYADAESGSLLQRVVQNQGSAFYDVAPRSSSKLRVETPYLVAVIKGTEFDVTIADETTSVALFEGQLQIEALDIAEVVQLVAGQIARRHKNDPHITVLNMEDGEPVAQSDARATDNRSSGQKSGDGGDATATVTTRIEEKVGDIDAGVGVDAGIGVGVKTGVGLAAGSLGAELNLGAELLATSLELDVGLDTSLGDTELDVGLAAGDLTLDVGADLGLGDTGIDVDLGAGDVTLDLGADDGTLDVELDLGIDEVPVVEVEISADTVVDLVPDLRDLLGL